MNEDIIGMHDMNLIFDVTDGLGIDREQLSVDLEKVDPGSVSQTPSGQIEIVIPRTVSLEDWLQILQKRLNDMGYNDVNQQ